MTTTAQSTAAGTPMPVAQRPFEVGIYTFAELTPDPATGAMISPEQRLQNLVESVELADQVGLDVFGLGEHHRPDYVSSAPAVILGALAARTHNIRLSTAVTVLSSDDPVRVFQDFATLDLLSHGRAEIMAGRGSFIESFPLFGYDLKDYDTLFTEKLELLLELRKSEKVTWSGMRAPLQNQGVYPRRCRIRCRSGSRWAARPSLSSAGTLGLPLAIAIIGGMPERFAPFARLYREAAQHAGHDPAYLPVSINSHGFIADDPQQAADDYYPSATVVMNKIGASAVGARPRQQLEANKQLRERISWARRRRSSRRFCSNTSSSSTTGCSCNWASAPLSTRRSCARSSCWAPRWRRWCGGDWEENRE
ncbi:MAG: LLM class flavin-dependent oxidoreductase [Caldilineaceae bacterium]